MNKTRLVAGLTFSVLAATTQAAVYNVVELPLGDIGLNKFPTSINTQGQVTVNVQSPFNPPIDVSLIDFESQILIDNLTDIDSAMAGQPNDVDYVLLYNLNVAANASGPNQFAQQIASTHSYITDDNAGVFIPGFDHMFADTDEYNFSTNTNVRSVNEAGHSAGSGQDRFYNLPYINDAGDEVTYVVSEFLLRGFATVNGVTVALPPTSEEAGGLSDAFDINNNNQVVGVGSVKNTSEVLQTSIDNCADPELRGDVPAESCLRALMTSTGFSGVFQQRGLIWQVDESGGLLSTQVLGLLLSEEEQAEVQSIADDRFESDTNPEVIYTSQAIAINDNGIAVGLSSGLFQDTNGVSTFAAIFDGDTITEITDDEEYFRSLATDINNNNLIVGHAFKSINGANRSKFFVHDLNTGETEFPVDFFVGSASIATGINNNGIVVGYGEFEGGVGGIPRRTRGFVYDSNSKNFQGLDSLLGCDSPFTIVQANGINDANEIIATALVVSPALDIQGKPILDENGADQAADRIVAVKLVPIPGGVADDCDLASVEQERQGASSYWLSIFALLLFGVRRLRTS